MTSALALLEQECTHALTLHSLGQLAVETEPCQSLLGHTVRAGMCMKPSEAVNNVFCI